MAVGATPVELSRPTETSLLRLQEQWLRWLTSFYQSDADRARTALDDLLATAAQLGARGLPDLSVGAAVRAVQSQRENNPTRAEWALEAAERLDPGRPETAFAEATVRRLQGAYHRAFACQIRGYLRTFARVPWGDLMWRNLALWVGAATLLACGLFVALAMAVSGPALLADGSRLLAWLPALLVPVGLALLLLWPLLLPHGLLWTTLYWSILLWAYVGAAHRAVFALGWLLLAGAPFTVDTLTRPIAVELEPSMRAARSLASGRLYGSLFTDLSVLRDQLPEHPAVDHMVADLHRRLGQWEYARPLYEILVESEPDNVGALLALGAYNFRKGDFGRAVGYFQRAATADSQNAAAYYDLSIAHSESYQFSESNSALQTAQALDTPRVSQWIQQSEQGGDQRIVTIDGGFSRVDEVAVELARRQRATSAAQTMGSRRRILPLAVAVGAALLALALQAVRRAVGVHSFPGNSAGDGPSLPALARALLPGHGLMAEGRALSAFGVVFGVVLALLLPFAGRLGVPVPWGYDPGGVVAWTITSLVLLPLLALRVRMALRGEL